MVKELKFIGPDSGDNDVLDICDKLLTCPSAPCRRSPRIRWVSGSKGPHLMSRSGHSSSECPSCTLARRWPGSWGLGLSEKIIIRKISEKIIIIHGETDARAQRSDACRYLTSADWKLRLLLRLLTTFPRKNPSPFHIDMAHHGLVLAQGSITRLQGAIFAILSSQITSDIVKYYISLEQQNTFHSSCGVGKQAICNLIFLRHNLIIAEAV